MDEATRPGREVDDEDDRDRAEGGDDDALDVDAVHRTHLEDGRRDEPADDAADDAQGDHHQEALTGVHDLAGQEAGDRADDDPCDEAHRTHSFRCWDAGP